MKEKKENIFIEGAIPSELVLKIINNHQNKTSIGGHSLFLGQVREDDFEGGKKVQAIEFTVYQEMALRKYKEIKEKLFETYPLICIHMLHSLGMVKKGEICLFVMISSKHRKAAMEACNEMVEQLKKELPIWGKELFDDQSYLWKENKY